MTLFKKIVMNGIALEEYPFQREFELEGCLEFNPELLCLDDEDLGEPHLIAVETFIKKGRGRRNGRTDMIVAYSGGQIGIVELKRGKIDKSAYEQLSQYLSARDGLSEVAAFKEFLNSDGNNGFELSNDNNFVGVLVGQEIDDEAFQLIKESKTSPRIYAIEIRRLKTNSDTLVLSTVTGSVGRDTTKFRIGDGAKKYGKGRLVLEVIRRYVANKDGQITYDELERIFPASLRGVKRKGFGCFLHRGDALRQTNTTGYVRHYLKDDEIVRLSDGEIAVSSQWGADNIDAFIRKAEDVLTVKIHRER